MVTIFIFALVYYYLIYYMQWAVANFIVQKFEYFAQKYPHEVARAVLGLIGGWIFAYLFGVPYTVDMAVGFATSSAFMNVIINFIEKIIGFLK